MDKDDDDQLSAGDDSIQEQDGDFTEETSCRYLNVGILVADSNLSLGRAADTKESPQGGTRLTRGRLQSFTSSGVQPVASLPPRVSSSRGENIENTEEERTDFDEYTAEKSSADEVDVAQIEVISKTGPNQDHVDKDTGVLEGKSDPSRLSVDVMADLMRQTDEEEYENDWIAEVMRPISLPPSLLEIPARQSTPGAFAVSPTNRRESYESESATPSNRHESLLLSNSEEMLVQATLVDDEDTVASSCAVKTSTVVSGDEEEATNDIALVEAKPVAKLARLNIPLLLMSLVAAVITAIALGVLPVLQADANTSPDIPGEHSNSQSPSSMAGYASLQPSGSGAERNSQSPSSMAGYASVQPSGLPETHSPSAAPTATVDQGDPDNQGLESGIADTSIETPTQFSNKKDQFYARLPSYTKDSFKFSASPQVRAYNWLLSDPFLDVFSVDQMLQRFALMTLLMSIKIDKYIIDRSEMFGIHECQWNSLFFPCNDQQELTGVWLDGVPGLNGTLANEIGMLSSLIIIDMSRNELLQGVLPSSIGEVTGLQVLNLEQNSLSGSLPYSLSSLTELEDLNLSNNLFVSTIPAEMGFQVCQAISGVKLNQFKLMTGDRFSLFKCGESLGESCRSF